VLDAVAALVERIVALAVVPLHAGEVLVGRRDELGARHPLVLGDGREERLARRAERFAAVVWRARSSSIAPTFSSAATSRARIASSWAGDTVGASRSRICSISVM